jgi:hypothetical protein
MTPPNPTLHDYRNSVRGFGHDLAYRPLPGDRLVATGWGYGLKAGDYILLSNGPDDTRYSISEIEYYSDPPDMWKATFTFAPR